MTKCIRPFATLLLLLSLTLAAAAQQPTVSIPIKTRKVRATQSFVGTVQVFSHSGVTVQGRDNPYMLKTFDFSRELQNYMANRHLDTGDHVKVIYQADTRQAVRLKGKLRRGS